MQASFCKMCPYVLIRSTFFLFSGIMTCVSGVPGASLYPNTPLEGELCHADVHFTCTAVEVSHLCWEINGEEVAQRYLLPGSESVTTPERRDTVGRFIGTDITVTIISATVLTSPDNVTVVSTLDTTLTTLFQLQARNITCGTSTSNDIQNFTFMLKVPPPPLSSSLLPCTLTLTAGGMVQVTLPSSRTSLASGIGEYRVQVEPEPTPTCSRQAVDVTQNYMCSGFEVGRQYTYTVMGLNCAGMQEGEAQSFRVHPQVSNSPQNLDLVAVYNSSTATLIFVTVSWQQVTNPSISDRCSFHDKIIYLVILGTTNTASNTSAVRSFLFQSNICDEGTCTATLHVHSFQHLGVRHQVSVQARNTIGLSKPSSFSTTVGIADTSGSTLTLALSFEGCALCSTDLDVGECEVQYGVDPSYPDSNPNVNGPVNELFELPILQRSTLYYYQASITVNTSSHIIVRGQFRIGDSLTPSNQATITVCIFLFALALVGLLLSAIAVSKTSISKARDVLLILVSCSSTVSLCIVLLWITTAVKITSQTNICDVHWQNLHDSLILTSGISSVLLFLLNMPLLILSWMISTKFKSKLMTTQSSQRNTSAEMTHESSQAEDIELVIQGSDYAEITSQEGVATGEEGVATGQEGVVATGEEGVATGQEGVATGEEGVATGQEGVATGEEGVATGQEGVATGQEGVVATGQEEVATCQEAVVTADPEYQDIANYNSSAFSSDALCRNKAYGVLSVKEPAQEDTAA